MRISFNQIEIEVHFLGYVAPKPGWYIGPHSHQQYEMHFITRGKGRNRLATEELALYPHVVYMAPPHEIHEQFSDLDDPMEIFFMPFTITGLERDLPHIYAPYPYIHNELKTILPMQRNAGTQQMFNVQMRLIELVWTIISPSLERERSLKITLLDSHNSNMGAPFTIPKQIVEQAIEYIQNHKLDNPSIDEIAESCHISSRQLTRLFNQAMHSTIHSFIQQERYLWACKELRQTDKSLDEISEDLNLCSKQYFCHWFKSFSLKSPARYRNEETFSV